MKRVETKWGKIPFLFFYFKMKSFLSNKTGFFLCILIISILLNTFTARAEISPDSPHFSSKPIPCIGCHQGILDAPDGRGECGDCHKYRLPDGGIDVPKMEAEHNPNICRACHISNTATNESESDIYHNAHNTIQCVVCHVNSSSSDNSDVHGIKKGIAFQCVSCHGNKIHNIHSGNLSKACPVCHGSWAAGKTTYNPESAPPQAAIAQEKTAVVQLTILDVIKNIFNSMLKMFGS
jgi:hypothetical protein